MDMGIIQPVRGKRDPTLGPDALMVLIPSELEYLVRLTEGKILQTTFVYAGLGKTLSWHDRVGEWQ